MILSFTRSAVIIPSVENSANAREKMMTQLIKFGRVVKVCTNFLTGPFLISLSRIAKIIGRGVRQMLITANITVFFNVLSTLASVKIILK